MQQTQDMTLGTEPVGKLLFRLAVPAITAQIVNVLYNMVDRMYIGRIPEVGALALTGVGVTFPIIMVVSAFAALIGMGGAPRASILMGQGNPREAERVLGNCVATLVVLALLLTGGVLLFQDQLLMAFGADVETFGFAKSYLTIYALGTISVQIALGLNMFITSQGFALISMLTVIIGAGINIILDPILIFGFHMGVQGAALATIISQTVSAVWVLVFLCGKKTHLRVQKKHLRIQPSVILPVMALGVSPFIMQSTESLITVSFNTSLLKYGGNLAVGAMTILSSVMQFSMLPLQGLTQGAQPIISFNYGALNADRVKKAFKLSFISCMTYSMVLWGLIQLFPSMFASIFTNDPALIEKAAWALRIYMAVSGIFGAQIACQQTFIALGNAKTSVFLAVLRKIGLLLPLIYIMPRILSDQVLAVFMAEPVADLIAVSVTVILFTRQFKRTLREIADKSTEKLAEA